MNFSLTNKAVFESMSDANIGLDQPMHEIFVVGNKLLDWRMSYGVKPNLRVDNPVWCFCLYPAFCVTSKLTVHHSQLSDLVDAMCLIMEHVSDDSPHSEDKPRTITTQDILAVLFSIARGKESFELFQEQKDLMELGLEHYYLSNMHQNFIKQMCDEYYEKGTVNGKPFPANKILGIKEEANA